MTEPVWRSRRPAVKPRYAAQRDLQHPLRKVRPPREQPAARTAWVPSSASSMGTSVRGTGRTRSFRPRWRAGRGGGYQPRLSLLSSPDNSRSSTNTPKDNCRPPDSGLLCTRPPSSPDNSRSSTSTRLGTRSPLSRSRSGCRKSLESSSRRWRSTPSGRTPTPPEKAA